MCSQSSKRRPGPRFLAGALAAALAGALVAGCGGEDALDPAALSAPGPYAVGHRLLTVTYQPPLSLEPRTTTVLVWYPAEPVEGERPLYLLRRSELAVLDAPPLALGPRPALFYSHGHQAYASVMSYLMEHVASHGYVAVAPTHTGNTFIDGAARETDIYFLRTLDVRAALDHLLSLEGDPLAGVLSGDLAMSGHSFGGYTTMALGGARHDVDRLDGECSSGQASDGYCSTLTDEKRALFRAGLEEPRFRALINFDPGDFGLFGDRGVAAVERPVLHFVAEENGIAPGAPATDLYWTALHGSLDLRLLLLGGAHNDFTDSCAAGVTIRCSELPPEEVWAPVRAFTLAFLNQHLLDRGSVFDLASRTPPFSTRFEITRR